MKHDSDSDPATAGAVAQAARRNAVQSLHRTGCATFLDADGTYHRDTPPDWREYVWHPMSLLNGDASHMRQANGLLRYIAEREGGHFWSSGVTVLLSRFADRIEPDLFATLRRRLATMIKDESKQWFRGYNDNYPAMAAMSTLVGSYVVGDTTHVQGGLDCLDSLQRLLRRRGALSEYCSPTYTAITLTCLAEIVERSEHPDARALASEAEQKIWRELLARFHPATSFLAGPFSRAYTVDLCGHLHNAHIVLYQVLGDVVFVNPVNHFYPPIERQILHGASPTAVSGHVAWQSTPTFHVPVDAVEMALDRRAPRVVRSNAEQAAFPRNFWKMERHPRTPLAEVAAGPMNTYSYIHTDYAFGVCDRPFLDGAQSTPFHLVYRRSAGTSLRDVATLFSRYVIDDRPPTSPEHIPEQGRALAVAHESTAMLLYRAQPTWGGFTSTADYADSPVRSLKLSLLMPTFYGRAQSVWLGEQQAVDFTGESVQPVSIFVEDGPIYFAIKPLVNTNLGRRAAVRLERVNDFDMISLINYEGAGRTFSEAELMTCLNGFVIELAAKSDWPSFEAFRAFHTAPDVLDQYAPDDGMRHVRYRRPGLELEMDVSPLSDGIRFASVNGAGVDEPRWSAQWPAARTDPV